MNQVENNEDPINLGGTGGMNNDDIDQQEEKIMSTKSQAINANNLKDSIYIAKQEGDENKSRKQAQSSGQLDQKDDTEESHVDITPQTQKTKEFEENQDTADSFSQNSSVRLDRNGNKITTEIGKFLLQS